MYLCMDVPMNVDTHSLLFATSTNNSKTSLYKMMIEKKLKYHKWRKDIKCSVLKHFARIFVEC